MSNEAQALTREMGGSGVFSTSQMIIMLLLADHADEKWSCFPSVDLLMHHSQLKERTVRDSLKQLSAKGVLTILQQRSQSTGAQLPNRYVLNKKAIGEYAQVGKTKWSAIKAQKAARKNQLRSGQSYSNSAPDGFVVDGPSYGVVVQAMPRDTENNAPEEPLVSAPANNAPLPVANNAPLEEPLVSAPANNAPLPVGVQETAGRGAGNCKNTMAPLKGTRADLTINQESSIQPRDERETFEPIATPVFDETTDDDLNLMGGEESLSAQQDSSTEGLSGTFAEANNAQPRNVHRGVNLDELFDRVPENFKALNAKQIIAMIDVVLNRAGMRRVARPTAYVLKAINDEPWGLLNDIQHVVTVPTAGPRITHKPESIGFPQAPVHEPGIVAECEVHDWDSSNPMAICPSCRSNFLVGESHLNVDADGNARPGKPQAGWFRVDLTYREDDDQLVDAGSAREYGAHDEPPF